MNARTSSASLPCSWPRNFLTASMNRRSPSGKVSDIALNTAVATGSPPSQALPRTDSVRKRISRGMTAMSVIVCTQGSGVGAYLNTTRGTHAVEERGRAVPPREQTRRGRSAAQRGLDAGADGAHVGSSGGPGLHGTHDL